MYVEKIMFLLIRSEICGDSIGIDWKVNLQSFKLTVPAGADLKSLENLLKVVTQLNV